MADAKPNKPRDIALLHGPTEDGEGAKILRYRDGELSAGEVRPVREGQPLNDRELVRLKPLPEGGPLCEVEVVHGTSASASRDDSARNRSAKAGPARVSNDAFRRNWNQVFGKTKRKSKGVEPNAERDLNLN